jgi:hypothetical protein
VAGRDDGGRSSRDEVGAAGTRASEKIGGEADGAIGEVRQLGEIDRNAPCLIAREQISR